MPHFDTKFHGKVEYSSEQILRIDDGLFGFPGEQEWLLLEILSLRPLVFLQSVRTSDLCFLALPAQVVRPDYKLVLESKDIVKLGFHATDVPAPGRDILYLALLTIGNGRQTTANLQSPLVINIAQHRGIQVIAAAGYSQQERLEQELAKAC